MCTSVPIVTPLVTELETWMRAARGKLSRDADVAKAMDYMLKRWDAFTCFLGDGRICLTNNAAERALRGIALGRSPGCSPDPTSWQHDAANHHSQAFFGTSDIPYRHPWLHRAPMIIPSQPPVNPTKHKTISSFNIPRERERERPVQHRAEAVRRG
jgi:hypothetical protein